MAERPRVPSDPPASDDPGAPLVLRTERGDIACRYHAGGAGAAAVVLIGGTDAGLQGPADWIYPTLAADLGERGIAALRVDFRVKRAPGDVEEAVFDVLAAVAFLAERERCGPIAVVGHSFGGAVAIEAAARQPRIAAVVGLSNQTAGAGRASLVAPRPLLLVHGLADDRLPPMLSRLIYSWARPPRSLVLLDGARHSLRQRRDDLRALLLAWLTSVLAPPPDGGP